MSNRHQRRADEAAARRSRAPQNPPPTPAPFREVDSLLDAMVDGNEYGSLSGLNSTQPDLVPEIRRALTELETIRGRKSLVYAANVIKSNVDEIDIRLADNLPFAELVASVPAAIRDIDIVLVTPGGSVEQVSQFVRALRPRFDSVEFILPYMAMSAGTLWAMAGERVWMDDRAFIGPVDPQVRSRSGGHLPAQALLALLDTIGQIAQRAVAANQPIPPHLVLLLNAMDQTALGAAMTATRYFQAQLEQYLYDFKFRSWTHRATSGVLVDDVYKRRRAQEVAAIFCDHQRWNNHAHPIHRDAAYTQLQVKIDAIEQVPGLQRAVRRLWALLHFIFERADVAKMIMSTDYASIRSKVSNTGVAQ